MTKRVAITVSTILLAAALGAPADATAGDAKGTVAYKGRTAEVKYAYLVKGPDMVSKPTIRRLILSTKDLGAKIAACKTMSCTDSDLDEGLSINLEAGPRLNYWMVMNGQKIQYSGTEPVPRSRRRSTTQEAGRHAALRQDRGRRPQGRRRVRRGACEGSLGAVIAAHRRIGEVAAIARAACRRRRLRTRRTRERIQIREAQKTDERTFAYFAQVPGRADRALRRRSAAVDARVQRAGRPGARARDAGQGPPST